MNKNSIKMLIVMVNIFAVILILIFRSLYLKGFLDLGFYSIPIGLMFIGVMIWINAYLLKKLGMGYK